MSFCTSHGLTSRECQVCCTAKLLDLETTWLTYKTCEYLANVKIQQLDSEGLRTLKMGDLVGGVNLFLTTKKNKLVRITLNASNIC